MDIAKLQDPVFHRLALIAGIAVFVALAFSATSASLWTMWQSSDHRHGLLVLPISAFLIWRLRHQLAETPVSVDWRGLVLVAMLAVAWVIARLAGIQVVEQAATTGMVPVMIFTIMGASIAGKILFPILKSTLLGAWLLGFVSLMKEVSMSSIVWSPGTEVAPVMALIAFSDGEFSQAVSLSCIMITVVLVGTWLAVRIGAVKFVEN